MNCLEIDYAALRPSYIDSNQISFICGLSFQIEFHHHGVSIPINDITTRKFLHHALFCFSNHPPTEGCH